VALVVILVFEGNTTRLMSEKPSAMLPAYSLSGNFFLKIGELRLDG
jgi:hypothetical protein